MARSSNYESGIPASADIAGMDSGKAAAENGMAACEEGGIAARESLGAGAGIGVGRGTPPGVGAMSETAPDAPPADIVTVRVPEISREYALSAREAEVFELWHASAARRLLTSSCS